MPATAAIVVRGLLVVGAIAFALAHVAGLVWGFSRDADDAAVALPSSCGAGLAGLGADRRRRRLDLALLHRRLMSLRSSSKVDRPGTLWPP